MASSATSPCVLTPPQRSQAELEANIFSRSRFGVGRSTGAFPAGHFAVCGTVQSESQVFSRLNEVANLAEFDVDEEVNYRWNGVKRLYSPTFW
jgi:hypothetical protein